MAVGYMPEYVWLVVVGAFAAFAFGWGTGSNDVANAFGTSVGARTLTMWQAVIIAAIFEFTGALVLGRVSTDVIAGKIATISYFYSAPELYAYGMVCALTVGFVWQAVASFLELNVSATHSIIGAICGFSLIYGGSPAVNWALKDTTKFPPYTGVVPIVLAWFVSPVLTCIASLILLFLLRTFILRRKNSYMLAFWVLPFAVMLTCWICVYFVLTKGAAKEIAKKNPKWTNNTAAWVSACVAGGCALLSILIVLPILKYRSDRKFAEEAAGASDPDKIKVSPTNSSRDMEAPEESPAPQTPKQKILHFLASPFVWTYRRFYVGLTYDIHKLVDEDPIVAAIHAKAEVFDPKTEYAFKYLQVFSACCVIFAHGAGEVGYMAGPLSCIWDVYTTGTLKSKTIAPVWVTIIGALGLVVGLATYGYKVTQAMGTRMAKLSPTRGFCAELSTACIIMIAAQYGLPTSSSQCITGGIIGVGLLEGAHGLNWKFLGWTFLSWACTFFGVGLLTAALFAMGVFAPSIPCQKAQTIYETQFVGMARQIFRDYNSTLFNYRPAVYNSSASTFNPAITKVTNATFNSYNNTLNGLIATGTKYVSFSSLGTVKPDELVTYVAKAMALLQANSINTFAQEKVVPGANLCSDATYNGTSNKACKAPAILKGFSSPFNTTASP